ncbi:MAG: tRNA (N6-threonylcarbamoyladenosine(37)-N6)-methyltransferase TrmO [Paludibacteraceae bacterium]|nr:tRNA (N6-threonylcarbamoyladenosine(37)-N6)-methyltransferase TrmO [Paludibacteraceae bacterium]
MTITPIAIAHNGFTQKFGIPRQSGCAPSVLTRIVFCPEYQVSEALRGIEQWSHLWLIWGFSANSPAQSFSPTVRPPRLGGNTRVGVFATRSPFRPNGLGLSSVKLEKVEKTKDNGILLVVSGADLMDGTPIYDIKPYIPYTDIHGDASAGFAASGNDYRLQVEWGRGSKKGLSSRLIKELTEILAQDPRPAYKEDGEEVYGLAYSGWNVQFVVTNNRLLVMQTKQL